MTLEIILDSGPPDDVIQYMDYINDAVRAGTLIVLITFADGAKYPVKVTKARFINGKLSLSVEERNA